MPSPNGVITIKYVASAHTTDFCLSHWWIRDDWNPRSGNCTTRSPAEHSTTTWNCIWVRQFLTDILDVISTTDRNPLNTCISASRSIQCWILKYDWTQKSATSLQRESIYLSSTGITRCWYHCNLLQHQIRREIYKCSELSGINCYRQNSWLSIHKERIGIQETSPLLIRDRFLEFPVFFQLFACGSLCSCPWLSPCDSPWSLWEQLCSSQSRGFQHESGIT